MALPPILSNLPFLKNFKAEPQEASTKMARKNEAAPQSGQPQDTVSISAGAQIQTTPLSADDPGKIHETASRTGEILEQNPHLTLGLDPAFA